MIETNQLAGDMVRGTFRGELTFDRLKPRQALIFVFVRPMGFLRESRNDDCGEKQYF